jgi:hypothetical protein
MSTIMSYMMQHFMQKGLGNFLNLVEMTETQCSHHHSPN